jgi:hypothetical protein
MKTIFLAILALCMPTSLLAKPPSDREILDEALGMGIHFMAVQDFFVIEKSGVYQDFSELIRVDPRAARNIGLFWRTKAKAHLTDFIKFQIEASPALKEGSDSAVKFNNTVNMAIYGYYYDHWEQIREMVKKRLTASLAEKAGER